MPQPGLRLPASASLSLASCWPLPQQLLSVSATGGGRRRCLPRGGFGIPESLTSSPEAPLQGELAAKQTERLYEVRPDLLRQRRGKFFRLSGFFANKNRAAGNVRTCGAVYRLEEIVLVENGFLSQFSKIVPIKIAYLRYAVCGCCLCIKNANCYKSRRDYKNSILHLAQKINPGSKNQGNLLFCTK